MKTALKIIERIIEVITVICGIWAAIETVKMRIYRKQLKEKADTYLDEELELEGNIRGPINVYSPALKTKKDQVVKLVSITAIGAIISLILNLVHREQY